MGVTKTEALELLNGCKEQGFALEVFKRAADLRDANLASGFWFTSGSGGLFACEVVPTCSYCTFFTRRGYEFDDIYRAIDMLDALGLEHFHISGGTSLDRGYDDAIVELVENIQRRSSMRLEVNLGPSFSTPTLEALKGLGIESITSSLEIYNERLFKEAKPGDSLVRRKALLKECDRLGIALNSMMLLGLGESSEDIVEHLFFLASFENFYKLRLSRFYPFANTHFSAHPRCPSWYLASVCAIARLVLPRAEISMAAGNNSSDDIALFSLAGGGNELFAVRLSKVAPKPLTGVEVHRVRGAKEELYIVDERKLLSHMVESFGKGVSNHVPAVQTIR